MASNKASKNNTAAEAKDTVIENVDSERIIVPKEIDLNQLIPVMNGFNGELIYQSSRTGEVFTWSGIGDEQEIELRELKNAKNSAKAFYANNWFMFNDDDKWVIDYLGLGQYYKNAINIDSFDDVLCKQADEVVKIVSKLSDGQKRSLSYRARQLVSDGTIDSRKVIAALEGALGVELIER